MSTKCTILYSHAKGAGYHFYFDYKDNDYHLDTSANAVTWQNDGFKEFLRHAGKILANCPFSDSAIYQISMKTGKSKKFHHDYKCSLLEKKRGKRK
jgi:hypothetical protein